MAAVAGASVAGTTVTGATVAYPPGLAHESFLPACRGPPRWGGPSVEALRRSPV
jgi:hypothetical protein